MALILLNELRACIVELHNTVLELEDEVSNAQANRYGSKVVPDSVLFYSPEVYSDLLSGSTGSFSIGKASTRHRSRLRPTCSDLGNRLRRS